MDIYRSVRAVTAASGGGHVDWEAVSEATKATIDPGSLALDPGEREGYTTDVRDARTEVQSVTRTTFDLPRTIEIQNRHHWIDANVGTFRRVMEPIEQHGSTVLPGVTRVVNTGTMTVMLSFLGKHVLGQYDPLLLADAEKGHALYFVRPNIQHVAEEFGVDYDRFRRWIAFHEVTHAAEFGTAPWLSDYLEERVERGVEALSRGSLDRNAFRELDATMTAVEGYAELVMDRAFDDEYADLRDKLDERRKSGGPLTQVVRRLLGLGLKRRQYERGKAFFDTVADERGIEAAGAVWERPENLPTSGELDHPHGWLARVDP